MSTSVRIGSSKTDGSAVLALLVLFAAAGGPAVASNCSGTTIGRTPLNDLGSGTYQGQEGGLYPGGSNQRPATHDRDLDRVGRVQLLNSAGQPDAANGKIVFISIGMSNTTMEFSAFVPRANADPEKNSRVVIVDCAEGGQASSDIADPAAPYWTFVDQRLAAAGVTPAQVEVVWLKEARRGPTEAFPMDATLLEDDLRTIVQIIKSRYASTKSVYLASRTYAGYATSALNPEPYAYQSGFSVRWLIEAQLMGDPRLNFDPSSGPVLAPWLAWGPYLWADGLDPRSDGLTWQCSDFSTSDGTHPSPSGVDKVDNMLLSFFKNDSTTVSWFKDCNASDPSTFASPPEAHGLRLDSLGAGETLVSWESLDPVVGAGAVYDLVGGALSQLRADGNFGRATCLVSGFADTPYTDTSAAPPVGDAEYFLVRGRNGCGLGTYGDSGLSPDPRDALDAGAPACP